MNFSIAQSAARYLLPLILLAAALHATPTLSAPVISPSTVVMGQATPVTATCQVTTTAGDPALLTGGMNMVRLTVSGADAAILGVMTAGANGTYSYSFTDTEPATGQYELQCTAAFAATIGRVRSVPATVTVTPPGSTAPTITSISPLSGTTGAIVTVNGTHLVSGTGATSITLASQNGGSVAAPLSSATATTLTFVIPTGAATGPATVTTSVASATSLENLTINPPSTFMISATPATASLIQGQTVAYAVQLNSTTGFNQLAPLSVSGLPTGVTASFRPSSITAGQTSILTLSAPSSQPISTANISITAAATVSGIPLTQSATAALAVTAPTTTFLGRTVVANSAETPLVGVTVTMLGKNGGGSTTGCSGSYVSDSAGNFALTNLSANCVGPQLVAFNGNSVTSPAGKYASVNLVYSLISGQVTASPVLVHLPMITGAETFLVQQNAAADQPYSFSSIPGLSVTVYAHTTFTEEDGTQPNPFPLVAVEVPVDRLPEAMPSSNSMVMGFIVAFQPANVVASQPVAVTYPNTLNAVPGITLPLMTLNPTLGRMVPYGHATVSADGTTVVPNVDPSTGTAQHRYGIVNFDWHGWGAAAPNQINPSECRQCDQAAAKELAAGVAAAVAGDPVDLSSGLQSLHTTDLFISGTRGSIGVPRTYRTLSTNNGTFGPGHELGYAWQLNTGTPGSVSAVNLIAPDGNQLLFSQQTNGTFTNSSVPSQQGAVMTTNGQTTLRYPNGTVYTFQAYGSQVSALTSITDRNGNTTTFTLETVATSTLRITQITDPVGRSINLTYDSNGHALTATDPIGRTVTYTYNPSGTLATVTDPNGGVTKYQYDGQNRMTSMIDPRGVTMFQDTFDANGRVSQQVRPDGGVLQFAYCLLNSLCGTNSVALATSPVVPPTSPVETTTVTDALGNQTTYRFNPQGFPTGVTDALGQTKNFTLSPGSNLVTQVSGPAQCAICGPLGRGDMSFTYDSNGNMLTSTDAVGNTTSYAYDPTFNQVTSITDPLGHTATLAYDAAGDLISVTDQNGNKSTFTYNANGLLLQAADPLGNKTSISYDQFANPVSVTDPLGNVSTSKFDTVSRLVSATDPLGRTSSVTYDALNRIVSSIDGRGSKTQFSYDPVSNLLTLTDPRGNATAFVYDTLSRITTRTSPLGKSQSYQYDLNGNLTQYTDRRGQISTFQYDALNRLAKTTYQDGSTVMRAYDPYSRPITINDSVGGSFGFGYDANGRLVSQTEPTGSVSYTRDQLQRVATRQVAGQSTVAYSYDPAGNMLGASLPNAGLTYSYDPRNLPVGASRTNTVTTKVSYDPLGRVLSLTHAKGATTLNTQTYTYDQAGYLNNATNDISQPLITQTSAATVDQANELLTNGTTTYTNDANGNRLTETGSTGTLTYLWDSRNRLSKITDASGNTTVMHYDFERNLLEVDRTTGGSTTTQKFVIDNLTNVVSLTDTSGLPVSVLTGRSIDSHLASIDSAGNIAFGIVDTLGSTAGVTNSTGSVTSKLDYEPYGQTTGVAPMTYPFAYTGRVPVLGNIYYYRDRFYDTGTGRFLGEDPIGIDSGDSNLYRYVSNVPVLWTDPTGQDQKADRKVAGYIWGVNSAFACTAFSWGIGAATEGVGAYPANIGCTLLTQLAAHAISGEKGLTSGDCIAAVLTSVENPYWGTGLGVAATFLVPDKTLDSSWWPVPKSYLSPDGRFVDPDLNDF